MRVEMVHSAAAGQVKLGFSADMRDNGYTAK